MKLVKVLGIIALVLAVLAGGVWQFWGKDLAATAKIGAAYAAKHVCSCVHIGERSLESCKDDFVQPIGQLEITQDGTSILAKAPMGLGSAEATFEPGLGCAFVQP